MFLLKNVVKLLKMKVETIGKTVKNLGEGVVITTVLDKRYAKKDGSYNVSIQVYHDRKYLYVRTKYSVVSVDELTDEMNADIENKFDYVRKIVKNLIANNEFSLRTLNDILSAPDCNSLNDAMRNRVNMLREKGQISTANHYECAINKFEKYYGSANDDHIPFSKVNAGLFKDFKSRLEKEGRKEATIMIYMSDFKTVINEAIANKLMDEHNFPFKRNQYDNKCEIPNKPNKRSDSYFTRKEMDKIFKYYEESTTDTQKKWLSLFLFSYLAGGINVADMLRLKYDAHYFNTEGKEFRYIREKTKRKSDMEIHIPILDYMRELIKTANETRKNYAEPKRGAYVFPFLNDKMSIAQVKREIQSVNALISSQLKTIARKLEIEKDNEPSMTYARHSFSKNMKNLSWKDDHGRIYMIPTEIIEYAMGHVLKGVSGNYLDGYNTDPLRYYISMLLPNPQTEAA